MEKITHADIWADPWSKDSPSKLYEKSDGMICPSPECLDGLQSMLQEAFELGRQSKTQSEAPARS